MTNSIRRTKRSRCFLLTLAGLLAIPAIGCISQEQYDESLRLNARLTTEKEQLDTSLKDKDRDIKAGKEREAILAGQITELEQKLKQFSDTEQQLRKSLDSAKTAMEKALAVNDESIANARRAQETQEQSRLRWEQEIADRDQKMDRLRSQINEMKSEITQLKAELEACEKRPTSQPGK